MSFQEPLLLLLALAAPLYWWLRTRWLRDDEKRLRRFVRPVLWEKVGITPPAQHTASRVLFSIAVLFFAAAAAGPVWGHSEAYIPTGGRNVVVALDVSRSMWCDDESPTRRWRAALAITRLTAFLLDRIPSSPMDDTALPDGTTLSNLVEVMATALPDMDLEGQVGVIFSDGGFHDFNLDRAVEEANSRRISLVAVGVGGDTPVTVPGESGPLVWQGDTVRTVLEEETLKELAEGTGGFYTRISEAPDLSGPLNEMLSMSSADVNADIAGATGARRFQYFLGAGLALVLAAAWLEGRGK